MHLRKFQHSSYCIGIGLFVKKMKTWVYVRSIVHCVQWRSELQSTTLDVEEEEVL